MKFNIDGQDWVIKFSYPSPFDTVAEIYTPYTMDGLTPPSRKDYMGYAGFAHRVLPDMHNPELARKLTLRRALKASGFTPDQRQVVWNAYLTRGSKFSYRTSALRPTDRKLSKRLVAGLTQD